MRDPGQDSGKGIRNAVCSRHGFLQIEKAAALCQEGHAIFPGSAQALQKGSVIAEARQKQLRIAAAQVQPIQMFRQRSI